MTSNSPTMPSSMPVLRKTLVWGGYLAVAIAVIGATLGGIFAGMPGIWSALIGTLVAVVSMGLTALSIIVGNKIAGGPEGIGTFFGIVLGGWLVKFVLFLVMLLVLKDQPWINPIVLLVSIIAGVLGSLIVDMVVLASSRMSGASDVSLPSVAKQE